MERALVDGTVFYETHHRKPMSKLIRKYTSVPHDLDWARKGVIVSVLNGEAIPVIQTRIEDAGFDDLDIIPLTRFSFISSSDVMAVFAEAQDFFNLFFSKPVRWDKNIMKVERGSWVRIYGTHIHAWSESFFKLCVFDCGIFLRVDNCTLSKERFDYARVLLATTSLEILNCTDKILIDGVLVELKIIEEWGFSIGEDACLLEDDCGVFNSNGGGY